MIDLKKGGNLQLSKISSDPILQVGLSWDENKDSTIKDDIDIDVFGIVVNNDNTGVDESLIRFYNNVDGTGKRSSDVYGNMSFDDSFKEAKKLAENSVIVITKDNLDGKKDGDDETLFINSSLLMEGKKVVIVVNIYEAKQRKQLFGMVKNAKCVIYGTDSASFDLGEDFSLETGVIVGEFYLNNGVSKFKALGEGFEGDLNDLIKKYK